METLAPEERQPLRVEELSAAAFAPFGQVIEAGAHARRLIINDGSAERYCDLALIDTSAQGGRTAVSIFRARPRPLPLRIRELERHRLGSQAFVPLVPLRFLVVVAAAGLPPEPGRLRCFLALPGQGVNLARGTWHHPLIALDAGGDFLVIDRKTGDEMSDCEALDLEQAGPAVWLEDSALDGRAIRGLSSHREP